MNTIIEAKVFVADALTRREIQRQEILDSEERAYLLNSIGVAKYEQKRSAQRDYVSGDSAHTYVRSDRDERYDVLCAQNKEQNMRDDVVRQNRTYWFITYFSKTNVEVGFLCHRLTGAQDAVLKGIDSGYISEEGTLYVGVATETEIKAWQDSMRNMWIDCLNSAHMARPISNLFPE